VRHAVALPHVLMLACSAAPVDLRDPSWLCAAAARARRVHAHLCFFAGLTALEALGAAGGGGRDELTLEADAFAGGVRSLEQEAGGEGGGEERLADY